MRKTQLVYLQLHICIAVLVTASQPALAELRGGAFLRTTQKTRNRSRNTRKIDDSIHGARRSLKKSKGSKQSKASKSNDYEDYSSSYEPYEPMSPGDYYGGSNDGYGGDDNDDDDGTGNSMNNVYGMPGNSYSNGNTGQGPNFMDMLHDLRGDHPHSYENDDLWDIIHIPDGQVPLHGYPGSGGGHDSIIDSTDLDDLNHYEHGGSDSSKSSKNYHDYYPNYPVHSPSGNQIPSKPTYGSGCETLEPKTIYPTSQIILPPISVPSSVPPPIPSLPPLQVPSVPAPAPMVAPVMGPIPAPSVPTAPVVSPILAPVSAPISTPLAIPVMVPIPAPVTAPVTVPVPSAPVVVPIASPVTAPLPAPAASATPILSPISVPTSGSIVPSLTTSIVPSLTTTSIFPSLTTAPISFLTTAGPTTAGSSIGVPTSVPALNIIETPTIEKVVATDPINIQVAGSFDPWKQQNAISKVVEEIFNPYTRAYVGDLLREYTVSLKFQDNLTTTNQATSRNDLSVNLYASFNATFEVGSTDEDKMKVFTPAFATLLVRRFFLDDHMQRLTNRLIEAGISVTAINVIDKFPAVGDPHDDGTTAKQGRNSHGSSESVPEISSTADKDGSSSAKIVGASCGAIIAAAFVGVAVLAHKRQRRALDEEREHKAYLSGTGSQSNSDQVSETFSFTDDGPTEIKPAALHVRNKMERERKLKLSSNSTLSSYCSNENPIIKEVSPSDVYTDNKPSGMIEDTGETSLISFEDGPDLVATGALKCLDGEESVSTLRDVYPEFELYQNVPPSPMWSLSNMSNMSPYTAEDDYLAARRRWHDEANDPQLIELPSHNGLIDSDNETGPSE